jgi:D-beta-D-heptose 7-phosphate kinase/D-beta-D-heptose 1-phosphate adenosyltransferase|tara:strand:+ start:733 stop:1128 length:396 start_codon:yes stop_codon:yes gene_type:complete
MRTVFTNGCFDILHRGHLEYLYRSSLLGDRLIVGINSDESVRKIKGPTRPINNQEDRKFALQCLSFVKFVYIFDDLTPWTLIETLKPDIVTKGGDYDPKDVVGRDLAKIVIISTVGEYSTTKLIERICNGK